MAEFNVTLVYDNQNLVRGIENDKRSISELAGAVNQFEKTTTSATKNAAQGFNQVQNETGNLLSKFLELKKTPNDLARITAALNDQQKASKDLARTIIEQRTLTNQWRQELIQVQDQLKRTREGTKEFKALEKAAKDLNRAIKENVTDIQGLRIQKNIVDGNIKDLKAQQQAIEATTKSTGDLGGAFSKIPGPIGGAIRQLKGLTAAARTFIATPLGLILAAIAAALAAVRAAFTSSEEGQNRFAKATGVLNGILSVLNQALARIGTLIIDVFTKPQEVFKQFTQAIKEFILRRITETLEGIRGIGRAVELVFSGKFKQAAKEAGKAAVNLSTGLNPVAGLVRDSVDAIVEGYEDITDAINKAALAADKRAEADKLEREALVDNAKLETQIAELRLKARQDDQFSAEQRAKFLTQAGELQDKIFEKEEAYLRLRKEARDLDNQIGLQTKEDLDAQAQATADLENAERKRLNSRREIEREIGFLRRGSLKEALREQEAFNKEIDKIEQDLQNKRRQRLLTGAGSDEERVRLAEQFAKEELEVRRNQALELARSEADKLKVNELFKELELKLEADFRDELNSTIRKRIEDEQNLEDDRFERLQQSSQRQRQLRLQSLEAELAGGVSADRQRAIAKERLELELVFERERAEALAAAVIRTEERIAEAREAGDSERVAALELELEDQLFAINENANNIIIAEANLNSERLNQQLGYLRQSAELQQRQIDEQLQFGNLSIRQQRKLERERLELLRQSIQAQLALVPDDSILADQFRENLRGIENEIRAFEQTTIPQLKGLGELFQETLLEQFGIDSQFTAELLEGFSLLKDSIFDSIRGGYELELEAIQNTISEREKSIKDLEKQINAEQRAREKGYANNVDALEERLEAEQELLRQDEQRKNEIKLREARFEAQIQSLQQGAQLATAVANIIRSESRLGAAGIITAGAAIVSMFAIWRKFRAQSEQLSQPVSLFTGGKIGDYLKPGYSPQSDRPGHGRGHMIEGTNIRVGADEWLVNAKTSRKQGDFIGLLNSGALDNVDLFSVFRNGYMKPDVSDSLKIVHKSNKAAEDYKANRDAKLLAKHQAKEMRTIIEQQTAKIEELDNRRPIIIPLPDGSIQRVSYAGQKKVVEVVRK